MNNNQISNSNNMYWLIGNSIDGLCCHPRQQRMSEQELNAYLESNFLADFNASRGEFDFSIYLDQKGFKIRQLHGHYLEGQGAKVVAQVDYMTADVIHRVVRCGRTFRYYDDSSPRSRLAFQITLPPGAPFSIQKRLNRKYSSTQSQRHRE